jgi:tricorn protease
MWVEDTIYFLSDRTGPVTLFSYDVSSGAVREVVPAAGFDVKSASAGPGGIVYDQFGSLHLFDLKSQSSRRIEVEVASDVPATRPHFEKVASQIRACAPRSKRTARS